MRRVGPALLAGIAAFFVVNVLFLVGAVAVNSLATRWLGTWLPDAVTTVWYRDAWREFQLGSVLTVTAEVVLAVVALSVAFGVPAAYALARRDFNGKRLLLLLFLLPLMVPPITYGIPLATVMYKVGLAGTLSGVILANLIPALPFVILVMTPFIEQIDPNLEAAARVFGADTRRVFVHVLVPQLAPGILAASLLVALYYAVFAAGVRAPQSVDAMAMVYMVLTLAWLLIALLFVDPTQLVS